MRACTCSGLWRLPWACGTCHQLALARWQARLQRARMTACCTVRGPRTPRVHMQLQARVLTSLRAAPPTPLKQATSSRALTRLRVHTRATARRRRVSCSLRTGWALTSRTGSSVTPCARSTRPARSSTLVFFRVQYDFYANVYANASFVLAVSRTNNPADGFYRYACVWGGRGACLHGVLLNTAARARRVSAGMLCANTRMSNHVHDRHAGTLSPPTASTATRARRCLAWRPARLTA